MNAEKNFVVIGSRSSKDNNYCFRGISEFKSGIDWNLVGYPFMVLNWINNLKWKLLDMRIVSQNSSSIFMSCKLERGTINFIIPISSASLGSILLELNLSVRYKCSASKLLLRSDIVNAPLWVQIVLKRESLYYSHKWEIFARDYRQLLRLVSDETETERPDFVLAVKTEFQLLYGPLDTKSEEFEFNGSVIKKDVFTALNPSEQFSFVTTLLISRNIPLAVASLQTLCTKTPIWFSSFVVNHFSGILDSEVSPPVKKSRQKIEPTCKFLWPGVIPEPIQLIILNLMDFEDFGVRVGGSLPYN